MAESKLRTVIVDDEPLARSNLVVLLRRDPEVEIVAECVTGEEAIDHIRRSKPDLVFLDVQMPECDGFDVLERLGGNQPPAIVFVTAYDQYALRAFESGALDYLLKPFDDARFERALNRAKQSLKRNDSTQKPERIVVKTAGQVLFVKYSEIDWVEAAANYVRIHTGNDEFLMRETMNAFEAKLDTRRFMRIHRSIIVNLEKIKELQPCNNGEYIVVLRTGKELSLSRSFRDRIQDYLRRSPTFLRGSSMQSTA